MNIHNFYNPYRQDNARVYRIIGAIVLLILGSWLTSCDSFTETDMPVSELDAASAFEDKTTATAAMTSIYSQLRDNSMLTGGVEGLGIRMGLYADELSYYGGSTLSLANYYNNTLMASQSEIAGWWRSSYAQIYAANSILERLEKSPLLQADKDRLRGEALFVRGLLHFYMLQLWGDVPYVTTTNYKINATIAKMPPDAVYGKIIADLNEAATLLPEAYATTGRVRPNYFAAKALLARVYLYHGQYAEAAENASAVLSATELYIWRSGVEGEFVKNTKTAIWQLRPGSTTANSLEAGTFVFSSGPPPLAALSASLMASFEPNDARRENWTREITDGESVWYHAYKYKQVEDSSPTVEYSIVLRLAEQYLIRAEARAQLGDLTGAKDDLDAVRTTAGLEPTTATTQGTLLTAILQERRVEFFTEQGQRFFDLKRAGALDAFLSGTKPDWDTTDRLLPLPESELSLNQNVGPQNPGY